MIKKIIQKLINNFGYSIVKKTDKKNAPALVKDFRGPMTDGLRRRAKSIASVGTIIDVGAAAGTWYEQANKIWPGADYILFEPLTERRTELEKLKAQNPRLSVRYSALGKERSTLQFTVSEDLDGSGFYGQGNQRDVAVESLDEVLGEEKKAGPYILKLDTHGFEIPIFQGASNTLKNTELIIVETYGFYVAPNSLLFWQICQYLDEQGFRLVDIVDIMRRESDNAFWQCDAFFIKKDNPIFSNDSYS